MARCVASPRVLTRSSRILIFHLVTKRGLDYPDPVRFICGDLGADPVLRCRHGDPPRIDQEASREEEDG